MFKLKLIKSIAMMAIVGVFQVQAMETPKEQEQKVNEKFSSICVRGEFGDKFKNSLHKNFDNAFIEISSKRDSNGKFCSIVSECNGAVVSKVFKDGKQQTQYRHQTDRKVFVDRKKAITFHNSLCIAESPKQAGDIHDHAGKPLDKVNTIRFLDAAQSTLNPDKLIVDVNKTGRLSNFLIMIHGFDKAGEPVNCTYKNGMPTYDELFAKFSDGITHLHFSVEHETNGVLAKKVENDLVPLIQTRKLTFTDPYEGKFDEFLGHITLAHMYMQGETINKDGKNVPTKKFTITSPKFKGNNDYKLICSVYAQLKDSYDSQCLAYRKPGTVMLDKFSIRGRQITNEKGDIVSPDYPGKSKCSGDCEIFSNIINHDVDYLRNKYDIKSKK